MSTSSSSKVTGVHIARLLFLLLLLAPLSCLTACGEATDRPQDCSADEFFDEADSQCTSCPALTIPGCREGCAILVSSDDRGCPEASCDLSCDACPQGSSFSLETLSCEPLCPEGSSLDPFLNVCSSCPGQIDALPACDEASCLCSPVISFDEQGCASAVCGACSNPSQGFEVDAAGFCAMSPAPE